MNIIEKYDFGLIIISGRIFHRDVIVFPDEIHANWWRKEGHKLCIEDLEIVLKKRPNILIIGTGYSGVMRVPEEVKEFLKKQGIEVIIENTQKAVETYNKLARESKNVAAALHLTC
ncbi:MAG: Mth938-like domain-containing protein [Candidatus Korarchaeota archaeon]